MFSYGEKKALVWIFCESEKNRLWNRLIYLVIFEIRPERFNSTWLRIHPWPGEHLFTVSLGRIYLIMQPHYFFRLLLYLKWVSARCGWTMSLQESQITSKLGVEWPQLGNSRPYLSLSLWTFISRCFFANQPLFKHCRGITGQCCAAWGMNETAQDVIRLNINLLEPG